eukprot:970581-Prorocentrum_minimum.AAC.1
MKAVKWQWGAFFKSVGSRLLPLVGSFPKEPGGDLLEAARLPQLHRLERAVNGLVRLKQP